MNNDNFYQSDISEDKSTIRSQQFYPGRGPDNGQFPGRGPDDDQFPGRGPDNDQFPGRGPDFEQFPGMQDQPRTAPPNFIPEGPSMDGRQRQGGPSEFGQQYRGGGQVRPRELRRCLNRFTYIWLDNGNNFWFFPTRIGNQFVQGFRWRRNRWEFDRINLRRIFFFRCF